MTIEELSEAIEGIISSNAPISRVHSETSLADLDSLNADIAADNGSDPIATSSPMTPSLQQNCPGVPLWSEADSQVYLAKILHRFILQVGASQGGLNLRIPWRLMESSPAGSVLTAYSVPHGFRINKPALLQRPELVMWLRHLTERERNGLIPLRFRPQFVTPRLLVEQQGTLEGTTSVPQTSIEIGSYQVDGGFSTTEDPSISGDTIVSSDERREDMDMLVICLICKDKLQAPFITS
ncbi:hypothetical protein VKT23_019122 [Stygiomarasmius scandens]|uniref:Uncharacterized protein n=1 Tax=Marasmiellus scandens TaxID=2682957 RepID=A0ABR1IMK7_9AGAR